MDAGHRALERAGEPLGELRRLALVAQFGEHGELVAAEAGERLRDVERLVEPRRDLDQHLVADRVPVGVVDGAEAVQAEQEDGDARPRGPRERLFEPLLEQEPVRQAR